MIRIVTGNATHFLMPLLLPKPRPKKLLSGSRDQTLRLWEDRGFGTHVSVAQKAEAQNGTLANGNRRLHLRLQV